MDLERLPGLSNEADQAFREARAVQTIGIRAHEAALLARESIKPYADIAKSMIEDGIGEKPRDDRSRLVKVGESSVGESIYVFAEVKGLHNEIVPEPYGFITCVAMELESDDYNKLAPASQRQLELLGKSLQGQDLYGTIIVSEWLFDICSGYSGLGTNEEIDERKDKSARDLEDIAHTVEYVKTGIMTKELNSMGTSIFPGLAAQIEAERQSR